jgi:hypothetical protein
MNDSLKEFIHRNRERFDDREPNERGWENIESRLPKLSPSLWNSVVVWRSAAILVLSVSMFLFFFPIGRASKKEQAAIRVEFKDLESYYSNQIFEKKELVTQFQSETGLTEDEVTQNIQKLEAMYQVLRMEMEKRPSQDVKDALVLNLLVRIDLLNQQLNKLDRQIDAPEKQKVNS